MQSTLQPSSDDSAWEQLAPLLDEAIGRLGTTDRNVVALRYFQNKSAQEIAAVLNIGEAAAKKRLARAVEKLRRDFFKRGINVSTTALSGAVLTHSVQAAPVALAKTVTAVALTKGAAAGGSIVILVKGALKAMTWAKLKFACSLCTAVLLVGSAVTVAVAEKDNSPQPDPVVLLKKVAAARERIKSGEMEFIVARHDFKWNIQTNYSLLKVVFDGEKRRFEQLQRESAYVPTDPQAIKSVEPNVSN